MIGVEGSVTGDTGSATGVDAGGNSYNASFGRTFDATGRVGYVVNPTGLFYGRAGWTNAQFNLTDPVQTASNTRDGYLLGVGYERTLARHLSARLEYDYSHFSDRPPRLCDGYRRGGTPSPRDNRARRSPWA